MGSIERYVIAAVGASLAIATALAADAVPDEPPQPTAEIDELPLAMRAMRSDLAVLDELLPLAADDPGVAHDGVHALLATLEGLKAEDRPALLAGAPNAVVAHDALDRLIVDLQALRAAADADDDDGFRRALKSVDLLASCNACHVALAKPVIE